MKWALLILAATAGDPPIKIADYPTEEACKKAQTQILTAISETLKDAVKNELGWVVGPSSKCEKA